MEVAQIIEVNSSINYPTVWVIVLIYLLSLWSIVSLWVGYNAKARYTNRKFAPWAWGIAVWILNLPALGLYFLMRPRKNDENTYQGNELIVPVHQLTVGDRVHLDLVVTREGSVIEQPIANQPEVMVKPNDVSFNVNQVSIPVAEQPVPVMDYGFMNAEDSINVHNAEPLS